MTSPISPRVSERETVISRLAVPSARIFSAAIILVTGTGVASVFWQMPKAYDSHVLYNQDLVHPELAAVPLLTEAKSALLPTEIKSISLPALDIAPVTDAGAGMYGQVYPAPPAVAMVYADQNANAMEEESLFTPGAPQKFEPMRAIIDERPIYVEPIDKEFLPMPTSVSTTERSDALLQVFHFVENDKVERSGTAEPPTDLFPIAAVSTMPSLQPLQPLQPGGLLPLPRLREIEL